VAAYINFTEEGTESSIAVHPVPQTDMVDRYNAVWEAVKEDILISHQITNPLLVGIKHQVSLVVRRSLQPASIFFEANISYLAANIY